MWVMRGTILTLAVTGPLLLVSHCTDYIPSSSSAMLTGQSSMISAALHRLASVHSSRQPIIFFALLHFVDCTCIRKVPLYACFIDTQKAYDTVQHGLLWGRLAGLGVQGRMLAAIQSLYASGSFSMKVGGTAGRPQVQ